MLGYAESMARQFQNRRGGRASVAVAISLDDGAQPLRFYTTHDRIEGQVSFTAAADTSFDRLSIVFEGTARTWMERFGSGPGPSAAARTTVAQPFLRLEQPIDERALPAQRLARQDCTYTVPFTFVVPARLLPSACEHAVEHAAVRDAHLLLPPSLGDPAAVAPGGGGSGGSDVGGDDLAPDMTRISYAVHVRLLRHAKPGAGHPSPAPPLVLGEAVRPVVVVPAVPAAPPALVAGKSKDFVLRREKELRRGWLGFRRLGRLAVRADQPPPLPTHPLPGPRDPASAHAAPAGASALPSTAVTLTVSFVPYKPHTPPPPLLRLTARLRTATFFSTSRMPYLPSASRAMPDPCVGRYSHAAALSSRCLAGVVWERVASASGPRPVEYVATVRVPIAAPTGKRLVPSFASCYAARAYTVELVLSVSTAKTSCSSLRPLRLPLQVSCPLAAAHGNPWKVADDEPGLDVDEYFTPRPVHGGGGQSGGSGSGRPSGSGDNGSGNGSGGGSGDSGSGTGTGSGGSGSGGGDNGSGTGSGRGSVGRGHPASPPGYTLVSGGGGGGHATPTLIPEPVGGCG